MNLRVWIVDDEVLARRRLGRLLAGEAGVEVVGESSDGEEAFRALGSTAAGGVDLVFVDVEMPGMNGFELVEALGKQLGRGAPAVVFVTAHSEFSLRAFDAAAFDYLLKPTSRERLRRCLERVSSRLPSVIQRVREQGGSFGRADAEEASGGMSHPRIAVRRRDSMVYLESGEIDWVEAAGNYVVLHSGSQTDIVRQTLGEMEGMLPCALFLRISRSVIVRIGFVSGVRGIGSEEHVAIGRDGREWKITRDLRRLEQRLRRGD